MPEAKNDEFTIRDMISALRAQALSMAHDTLELANGIAASRGIGLPDFDDSVTPLGDASDLEALTFAVADVARLNSRVIGVLTAIIQLT